jgi:hypothetical protein
MRVGLAALVAVLVLGGCTNGAPSGQSPAVPVIGSSRPRAGGERTVPDDCAAVATLDDLTRMLGTFVSGPVQPIVGVPQEKIGRTARLDCYYGLAAGQPTAAAPIWIGLTSYVNEESARKRLTATVADERSAGGTASVNDVVVGDGHGVLVRDTHWMLVAGRGRVTVVVQVVPTLVREDHAGQLLGQVADFALTKH